MNVRIFYPGFQGNVAGAYRQELADNASRLLIMFLKNGYGVGYQADDLTVDTLIRAQLNEYHRGDTAPRVSAYRR